MSVPSSPQSSDPSKKEPKVIVLSMKDGKTFRYDFASNVLTNIRDTGAIAAVTASANNATNQSTTTIPPLPRPSSSSSSFSSLTQIASPLTTSSSKPNVVVQSIKKSLPKAGNILIRAQSPATVATSPTPAVSSISKNVQTQLSPIIDITSTGGIVHKISSDVVLKSQNSTPQAGATVLLNPLIKSNPQANKKFFITSQPQHGLTLSQPTTKIIQITQNQSAPVAQNITRKVIQPISKPMPILPKPEPPKIIQHHQIILTSPGETINVYQRPFVQQQQPPQQQIKQNVIAIPLAANPTAYAKINAQQQKWHGANIIQQQPPALSPIRPKPEIKSPPQMKNVKIVMEIEEEGHESDEEGEEIEFEKYEENEEDEEEEEEEENVSQSPEKTDSDVKSEVQSMKSDSIDHLEVKRIIEGDGGLNNFKSNDSEKKITKCTSDNGIDSKVKTSENDGEIKESEIATTITTTTIASSNTNVQQNSDSLLLCDEQIASISPEESPESITDKSKELTTPTHANESVISNKSKTVNDVKKNLKLDLIAATTHRDINSVNNKDNIDMEDEIESVITDDQSNESTPTEQKDEMKLEPTEEYDNEQSAEASANNNNKKARRNRKPKNPTIITSLGLPYKPPQPSSRRKKVEKKVELELDFHDPLYKILWDDGIGGLNNCNKLFGFNEFGLVEVLDQKEVTKMKTIDENAPTAPVEENGIAKCLRKIQDPKDQFVCDVCSKLGTIRDFFSPECCSESCFAITKRRPTEVFNNSNSSNKDENDSGFNTPVDAKKVMHNGEMMTIQQLYQQIFEGSQPDESRSKKKKRNSVIPEAHFSWDSYLTPKSVPAPQKFFKHNIAALKSSSNHFKVGMKLEAIDPKNQHLICVCTIEEKLGCRIKLHFDGFPSSYDFWAGIDSPNIFPTGFCESTNRKLTVPPRWANKKFDWTEYFDYTNSVGAKKFMFPRFNSSVTPAEIPFKVGMKVEAMNGDYWYAATIIDLFDEQILLRFDGEHEDLGCKLYSINSPYLNSCGGHKQLENAVFLPPIENFDWNEYLLATNSSNAPFDRANIRSPMEFEAGMKLEVVDQACKQLIRPATVLCQEGYKIQVVFDGFDMCYSFWLDDDCDEIFPVYYCKETEHPIEHPAGWNKVGDSGLCSIAGCRGIGNGTFTDRYFHDTSNECPYKLENWKRLVESIDNTRLEYKPNFKRGRGPQRQDSCEKSRSILVPSKKVKKAAVVATAAPVVPESMDSVIESCQDETSNDTTAPIVKTSIKRGRKRKVSQVTTEVKDEPAVEDKERNAKIRIMKDFLEDYGPQINYSYDLWTKNSKLLSRATITEEDLTKNPLKWTVDDVCTFLVKFCDEETTAKFYAEKIDGEALLSLCQKDLIELMGIKMGPAVKIYNRVMLLRQEVITKFVEF